jgi:DNA-binding response OmpR family regulator
VPAPAVLIVDDEQPLARILSFAFQNEGCVVDVATDGIDCMNRISRFEPGLVMMDIMMPRLDGHETIRLLRQNRLHRDMVIVAMSARGTAEVEELALSAGADLFIPKPFEIGKTIETVLGLLPAAGSRGD